MKLNEIKIISNALRNQRTNKIKILHKFLFDNEGDRKNRERIRNFEGFNFLVNDFEFKSKIESINKNFSLNDLIIICNILNISFDGSKLEICERLISQLCDIPALAEKIQNSESESESDAETQINEDDCASKNETEIIQSDSSVQCKNNHETKNHSNFINETSINFSDIESIITPFCANAYENISVWVKQFEDAVNLFNLSDLQKFIFAKKSLRGNALLFVKSEPSITSWLQLKNALMDEFAADTNSAQLHELLSKRKMKDSESLQEYYLKIKELCSRGNIDDNALMQYVIRGINDKHENKFILYGCRDLREFKDKLKVYETIKRDSTKRNYAFDKVRHQPENFVDRKRSINNNQNAKFCFNCGTQGHLSKFCPHKNKGLKCFKCENFGHKASECPKTNVKSKVNDVTSFNINVQTNMSKSVKIGNLKVNSLIDTGSQASLLRKSVFDKLNIEELNNSNSTLSGFGKCKIEPLGFFKGEIQIDDFVCVTNIYVVENKTMCYDAIVGLDVLMQGETVINENGITVRNKLQCDKTNILSVLPIDVNVKEIELDIGHDIPKIFKDKVRQLVFNYKPNKTKSTDVELNILVKNDEPIFHRPRRLPFSERKIVEDQVAEWLKQGIIEPSSSEYSSPVVIVKKKDGSPRLCIDYRRLNKVIVKDRFPLPVIEDVLDRLQESRVFSTIDLRNGFFHVDVNKSSRKYTSFVTHDGQYQFLKVPFGNCNSPSVFQRFINTIFRPLVKEDIVLPYMDDIIVLASNEKEAIERLERVLELASEYGLEINFKKSQFLKKQIEFLGHIIEEGCISPSVLKTKAVLNFPEPNNLKQIQSFLGLTGYFRKFIPSYSIIAKPLSDLLKKDSKFNFKEKERDAFSKLKTLLSQKPCLGIYNPNYETELHTDASLDGYGAILLQKSPNDNKLHPTYYMSRKTTDAEKKYSSYELEVLAIIEALKRFRIYLLGIPFKIVTDCASFQKTMEKKDLSTRVARWVLLLSEFNYIIEHRSGTKMTHVDALSRAPINTYCISIENVLPKLKFAQNEDNEIKAIKEILKTSNYDNYCERNGILYKFIDGKELIVIPEGMQSEIIKEAHEKGHLGLKHTEKSLNDYYFIPKLKQKIEKILLNCVRCILVNRKRGKQEGFLHPIHKDDSPLSTYHIDHLGPLESTNKNYKYIFAIIDGFTKFVWLYPTKTTSSAEVISKLELQKTAFGNPFRIISDRGTAFTSKEFEEYCTQENINHHLITTGLPRSNGQVERLNQVIISIISKLSLNDPSKWYNHVNKVQQVINSSYQRSINTTPFELLFGTKMKLKENEDLNQLLNSEFQEIFQNNREELRKDAKQQILRIQEENSRNYNLRRKSPQKYKLNDLVVIKRTQFGPHLKLKSRFLGPYKITKVKPNNTYDLERCGTGEGASKTSSCAEFMKPFSSIN